MNISNDSYKHQHYSQISFGNQVYKEKDAVIIKGTDGLEIAVINHIYDSYGESLLNVTKYIFAKNFKKLFTKQGLKYDKKNEVVQDLTKSYDIYLNQIIKKCTLAFSSTDNDESYYVNNFDPSEFFSCRYFFKDNQLYPLKDIHTILHTPHLKQNSTNKNSMDKNSDNKDKIEIHFENEYFSPTQRNQVKRNLNKSFGSSPLSQDKSILNYSIDSLSDDDEKDKRLILKLIVSKNQNLISSPPTLRKSNRNVTRKSYTDYISPKKTPSKRRIINIDDDMDIDPAKSKISKNTPEKMYNLRQNSRNTTPRRQVRAPIRYVDEFIHSRSCYSTPARRSLKLTNGDETNSPKNSKSSRKPVRSIEEQDNSENLDDSLRKNLLKHTFKKIELDENVENLIHNNTDNEDIGKNKGNGKDFLNTRIVRVKLERLNLTDDGICPIDSSMSNSEEESTPTKKSKIKKVILKTPKSAKKLTDSPRSGRCTSKSIRQSPKSTPKTPRNRAKLIREGIVTPSMQERSKKVQGNVTPLMQARTQLHVSYVPDSLPCREKEYCDIYNFVEGKLSDGCGGCMYISGVPGTGKTATVTSVIKHLQTNKHTPKFNFVSINGMRLTEPRQSYVEILKQMQGKTVPWEQAQHTLEDMFINLKKMVPTVMLIDELDILCTKRQDVVYNLLDWPTKAKNQLVVITIANTMDLPERLLMSRVTSRLGLTRLTFQAYTFKQLQEIVTKRLCGTNSFNPDAVQFVARKVASVSGDARRALDICRRSAEIAEAEGKSQFVGMNHVNEALNAMITQPKILAIKSCSRLEQLVLQSVVAEVERTGVEETTFRDVYDMLITCSAIEGFKMVSSTLAQNAVARLSACRLILADQKCNNLYQKIILNVSNDDIYYALQKNYS